MSLSLKRYSWYLLPAILFAISGNLNANLRDDRAEGDEYAWEIRPQFLIAHRASPLLGRPGSDNKFDFDLNLSYYGERLFLDDVLGYTWIDSDTFMFNTIASVTEDYFLFDKDSFDINENPQLAALSDRDPSINAGIELLFNQAWGDIALQIQTDLLSIHTGHIAELVYTKAFGNHKWEIRPEFGLVWASENYVNYFYGVSAADSAASSLPVYRAGSALNWYFSAVAKYELVPQWSLVAGYQVTYVDDTIVNSPILSSDRYTESYIGIEWLKRFNFDF